MYLELTAPGSFHLSGTEEAMTRRVHDLDACAPKPGWLFKKLGIGTSQ